MKTVLCAAILLAMLWIAVGRPWAMALPSLKVGVAVLAITTLSTALAYLIFFRLLASAGASNPFLITFLIPVSATVPGAVFLGEILLPQHLAGIGLISFGFVAINGRLLQRRLA